MCVVQVWVFTAVSSWCKQLVNDRGSNDAVYYFPKAQYVWGYKQPILTAASVCLLLSLSPTSPSSTQQHASFINNRFWHFATVLSLIPSNWKP